MGSMLDRTVSRSSSTLGKLSRAVKNVQRDVNKGATFNVNAPLDTLKTVQNIVNQTRTNINRGATFRVTTDQSGLRDANQGINDLRANAERGGTFRILADMSGISSMASQINTVRQNVQAGATFGVRGDTSGLAGILAEMAGIRADAANSPTFNVVSNMDTTGFDRGYNSINQRYAGLNGRRMTLYGGADTTLANMLPNLLGSIEQQILRNQTAMTAIAAIKFPVTLASFAGLAGGATAAAGAVASLAIEVGAGLVGALGVVGSAAVTAGGGLGMLAMSAMSALGNVSGMGKGLGTFAGAAKASKDEVKALEGVLASMPAGTNAAYQAQDRLRLAMEHQNAVTQLQIRWWGEYGAAANEVAANLNVVREGVLAIVSEAGGMLLPIINDFVEVGVRALPAMAVGFGLMVQGVHEGIAALSTYLETAQGMTVINQLLVAMGQAAGLATNILSNGMIVAMQVLQPMIPAGLELLSILSEMATAAGVWATSSEGMTTIATTWQTLLGIGGQLATIAGNVALGFVGIGVALAESGIGQEALVGLENLSARFRDVMSASGEGRQAIVDFMESAEPALRAIVPAAEQWGAAFLRVVDSIFQVQDATGTMTAAEAIIISIGNAADNVATIFEEEWATIGPMIAPLIDELVDLADTFIPATAEMQVFIPLVTEMMHAFNSLPEPMQMMIARTVAWSMAINTLTGGALGGLISSIGTLTTVWSGLAIASKLGIIPVGIDGPIKTITSLIWSNIGAIGAFILKWSAAAALGAIALDFIVNAPDIASTFASKYEESRAAGNSVATSFLEGVAAGLEETVIGSTLGTAIDGFLAWFEGVAAQTSLWDVLAGDATLQEGADAGGLGSKLILQGQAALDAFRGWLEGVTGTGGPTLMDVVMGNASLEESASGGSMASNFIVMLSEAWTGIQDWLTSLGVPEVNLLDKIMGAAEEEGGFVPMILAKLGEAWTGITEWLGGLVPEISFMDVLFGSTGEEGGGGVMESILTTLDSVWTSVTEWLGGLVPEMTLVDILMGLGVEGDHAQRIADALNTIWEHINTIWEGIKQDLTDAMNYIWNDVIVYTWTEISTWLGEQMSYIWNDIIVYYWTEIGTWLGTQMAYIWNDIIVYYWTEITTWLGEQMSYIWNDIIIYYWTEITTWLGEQMSYIWNDIFIYYWTEITTWLGEQMSYLWNDIFIYYWTEISTYLSETMAYIWNDIIIYYWDSITTSISDAMSYIWNDIIVYYWDQITTSMSDALTYIWNDVVVYYFDQISTYISDTWTSISEGVAAFVESFRQTLVDGISSAVNAALGWFGTLLRGAASVLSAIGADDTASALTGAADALPSNGAARGATTDEMARGGRRGGMGTKAAQPRHIVWNEQHNGREWWIAPGDADRNRQLSLLAGAASDLGMALSPSVASAESPGTPGYRAFARGGLVDTTSSFMKMAIGGGVDVGPEGLTGLAAQIANETMSSYGVWANTYVGGEMPHGSLHGNSPENTWDIWNDSGFGALDVGTGDSILAWYYSDYGSDLDTVIWNGVGEGPGGPFADDGHYDHLHASVGGTGIFGAAGALAARLLQQAQSMWNDLMSSIGTLDMGTGPLWDSVEEFASGIPEQVWNFILSKVPRGSGGFSAGTLSGDMANMAAQAIEAAGWPADELAALQELWNNESGWDPNAVNPESGAYGIPQINPSSWGTPAPLGDAAAQIEWGVGYIMDRYGSPSEALNFWLANGWYARGGSTDTLNMQNGGAVGYSQPGFSDNAKSRSMRGVRYGRNPYTPITTQEILDMIAERKAARQARIEARRARRQERRAARLERRGMTGGTLTNTQTSGSASVTGSSSGSFSGTSGSGAGGGGGGGRLSSSPISQSLGMTGSGSKQLVDNTGKTSGGGRITVNPTNTYSANISGGGGGTGGATAGGGSRRRRRRRTAGGASGSGSGQYSGYGTGYGSNTYANVQFEANRRHGGAVPEFLRGGDVPGIGPKMSIVHGGERVLPRNLNQGFRQLAVAIDSWESRSHRTAGGAFSSDGADALLEEIRDEIRSGFENPSPVKVDNPDELKAAFVAGALAANASDAGKQITAKQLEEGATFFMEMNGLA